MSPAHPRAGRPRAALTAALILFLTTHSGPAEAGEDQRTPLRVGADTSLEKVLTALETSWEALHPDMDLRLTFGPSGTLRDQIMRREVPADLFISAGAAEMGALLIGGRVTPGTSLPVATNRIMLVTAPRGRLKALTELREARIRRVALGNPGAEPLGREGLAALQQAGIWKEVQPKVRYCASSREVVAVVERSEVDAGLVYATDALDNSLLRVVMGLDSFVSPTTYVAAPVLDPIGGGSVGSDFILYLKQPAAQAVFARFHFGAP